MRAAEYREKPCPFMLRGAGLLSRESDQQRYAEAAIKICEGSRSLFLHGRGRVRPGIWPQASGAGWNRA